MANRRFSRNHRRVFSAWRRRLPDQRVVRAYSPARRWRGHIECARWLTFALRRRCTMISPASRQSSPALDEGSGNRRHRRRNWLGGDEIIGLMMASGAFARFVMGDGMKASFRRHADTPTGIWLRHAGGPNICSAGRRLRLALRTYHLDAPKRRGQHFTTTLSAHTRPHLIAFAIRRAEAEPPGALFDFLRWPSIGASLDDPKRA